MEVTIEDVAMQETLGDVAKKALKIAESQRIIGALRETKGNKKMAAEILQVSYKTLFTKIKEYDIKGIWIEKREPEQVRQSGDRSAG